jgi:hypothetical protein
MQTGDGDATTDDEAASNGDDVAAIGVVVLRCRRSLMRTSDDGATTNDKAASNSDDVAANRGGGASVRSGAGNQNFSA